MVWVGFIYLATKSSDKSESHARLPLFAEEVKVIEARKALAEHHAHAYLNGWLDYMNEEDIALLSPELREAVLNK
jgi:hypothetical protein